MHPSFRHYSATGYPIKGCYTGCFHFYMPFRPGVVSYRNGSRWCDRNSDEMTEKEKMLSGLPYDSRDPELLDHYHRARALLKQLNQLESTAIEVRQALFNDLFAHQGNGVWIETPFFCDYGSNISIGDNTFINVNCMLLDNHTISIGKNGLLAPYVQIYTANHPLKAEERIVQTADRTHYVTSARPVVLGDNVWVGGNSVICPGVTIGDNVTIGAGSVVTKDLPSNVLAMGSPCKIVKTL